MGPLVYYCRWRGAKLRLHGRDGNLIWGQLVFSDDGGAIPFRFDSATAELTLEEGGVETRLQLDELGVVIPPEDGPSATTSFGVAP